MYLMLGKDNKPSLLVSVEQEKSPTEFDFWVINGAWRGVFYNGYVSVLGIPDGSDFTSLDKLEILTDNQDRLRHYAGEWRDVFDNWNDPNYVAPLPKKVEYPASWDDDIPF